MAKEKIAKTNAARLLDKDKIKYEHAHNSNRFHQLHKVQIGRAHV